MIKRRTKKILGFSLIVIFLLFLFTLLYFINPEKIIDTIGVNNAYLIAFFISFFGGFSSGGSITFISILITFVSGGVNPIYLGIISGIGLAIGDLIMFYAGSMGRDLIGGKYNEKINKIANLFESKAILKKITPAVAYLYIGFTPLPNDILILFLAGIRHPLKNMVWIIILGDLTFALMITLLTANSFLG